MPLRLCILPILVLAAMFLAGCGGPTKKGMEARSDAAERVNMVNAQVSFDQARRSFEAGDLERGLREIRSGLARLEGSPGVPGSTVAEFTVLKGRILLELHRLEDSMRAFQTAIEHDEEHAEAWYFSGIINQRWSRHQEAFESYNTAATLDPENVQFLLAAAESLIALERYDEARELVQSRIEYHEYNAALRHLLGHIAMLENDHDTAATLLQEARLLKPDDPMLLEELALVRFDAEKYSSCYDALQELYRTAPQTRQRVDLRHLEARALTRMERYIEARRIYIELSQKSPGDVDVWIELAAIALELGDERRLDEGSSRVMTIAPDRHEGYLLRAVLEEDRGNTREAERLLSEAIERADRTQSDESHLSYLLLGRVFEAQGRFDQARDAYRSALRIVPDSREARALLSRLNDHPSFTSAAGGDRPGR